MLIEVSIGLAVFGVAMAAEGLHARRVTAIAPLLLGRGRRFTALAKAAPFLRASSLAAIAWAAAVLLSSPPQLWAGDVTVEQTLASTDLKRLMILLDVSPSMDLPDAGGVAQTRAARAAVVLDNVLDRVDLERTRVSLVPFYTAARPVLIDAIEPSLVHAVAVEPSLSISFADGETDLNLCVNRALDLASGWRSGSTTLLVITDGDSVSKMPVNDVPSSINHVMVAGVGDTVKGTFIDGHISRHDEDNLRQLALRLGGHYTNADKNFLPNEQVDSVGGSMARSVAPPKGLREIALATFAAGAVVLAMLPVSLSTFGIALNVTSSRPAPTRLSALPQVSIGAH